MIFEHLNEILLGVGIWFLAGASLALRICPALFGGQD